MLNTAPASPKPSRGRWVAPTDTFDRDENGNVVGYVVPGRHACGIEGCECEMADGECPEHGVIGECEAGCFAPLAELTVTDGVQECDACRAKWAALAGVQQVSIVDAETGEVESTCTVAEFFADNAETFSDADRAECRQALATVGAWMVGGGAAPLFRIELVRGAA